MSNAARSTLREWVFNNLDAPTRGWLADQLATLQIDSSDRTLYLTFGSIPRRLGKHALPLAADDRALAQRLIPGWMPGRWSVVDAGRILVLSGLTGTSEQATHRFRSLCQTADVSESVSLYRGLMLYPSPAALEPQVAEGLRTNIRSVFEAIACDNPYPREYFDQHRWNHMVLKALFIDSRLAPVQGLDERANEELARIMLDFAHERWAAGRAVPPEIWRCVGPFARDTVLADLGRALASENPLEQRAAALALAASPDPAATALLGSVPALASEITHGRLSWQSIGLADESAVGPLSADPALQQNKP